MPGVWMMVGAILAGLAVACGAFAAHGLDTQFVKQYEGKTRVVAGREIPLAEKFLRDFRTGAEYQMYHGLALIALGLLCQSRPSRAANVAGWCFLAGIILFSGSLYILTLTGVTKWGMITPIGGVFFLVGWAAFAIAARKATPTLTHPAV
ncbi:MAG TPA: DUF423 domain-containing protein [Planctomycetaceae bacterium]|nr:DUF423 domain-containing protein [Planctomycetaceae bacterium]